MQSDINYPGPGAYKPTFEQVDRNVDLASHTLTTFTPRITFIERMTKDSKKKTKTIVNEELGCCDRFMRHLSNDVRSSPAKEIQQLSPFKERQY